MYIQDTGSSSGTYLNGLGLIEGAGLVSPPHELSSGDFLMVGTDFTDGVSCYSH